MPAITRLGDLSAGHGGFPARPNIQASTNVFTNNKGVHRQGDAWAIHCSGDSCHGGVLLQGSTTVFVNGKQCSRIGDTISCADTVGQGSPNTFSG